MSGSQIRVSQLDIKLDVDAIIKKHTEGLANDIRKASPVGHRGKYAKGWAWKYTKDSNGKMVGVIYNATEGQLSHLLEFGHRVGKTNTYTRPKPHVRPALETRKKEFIADMKRIGITVKTREA